MQRMTLGRTGIEVSEWCLGTMTWGNQTPAADAHRQIDASLDAGIDFLDTAEMYPVNPVTAETAGRSEEVLGDWIAASGRRSDIVLATKVCGPNGGIVRGGAGYDGGNVRAAVEGSLRRLRTEVIDLYQLHWPTRGTYAFRNDWTYDPSGQDRAATIQHMDDVLGAMAVMVDEGKVRAFGLSNETAWGTTRWIDRAEATGGPRVATVQNEYSLMCRLYDTDMAEMSVNEDVTLLAFSPLAAGILTGKYLDGAVPKGSRRALTPDMGGRVSAREPAAARAWLDLAAAHGVDPVHMALAWHRTRPFASIPIFGATDMGQLDRILGGTDVTLSDTLIADIVEVHRAHPMPY